MTRVNIRVRWVKREKKKSLIWCETVEQTVFVKWFHYQFNEIFNALHLNFDYSISIFFSAIDIKTTFCSPSKIIQFSFLVKSISRTFHTYKYSINDAGCYSLIHYLIRWVVQIEQSPLLMLYGAPFEFYLIKYI